MNPVQRAITSRQREVLGFVVEYVAQHGYAPSLRDIMARFGIKSTNGANDHLRALERKGFISRAGGGKARAITVLPQPKGAVS